MKATYGEAVCKYCGKKFTKTHWSQELCSDACKKEHKRLRNIQDLRRHRQRHPESGKKVYVPAPREDKVCEICGKVFKGTAQQKYCSDPCRVEAKRRRERIRQRAYRAKGCVPDSLWMVKTPVSDEYDEYKDIEEVVIQEECGIPCSRCTREYCPYD